MELIVKVNSVGDDHTKYQDGDVVETFSKSRIELCHAEMICDHRKADFNLSGLRPAGSLAELFQALVSRYKFERVSTSEVQRTDLISGDVSVIGSTPNENGEYIDVQLYLKRRIRSNTHKIFGEIGAEVWYGGSRPDVDRDIIWNVIETHSDNLRNTHQSWPLSDLELMYFLPLAVSEDEAHGEGDDHAHDSCESCRCSNETAHSRVASVSTPNNSEDEDDDSVTLIAKRQYYVPYWDLSDDLGINVDDVRNMSKPVDARKAFGERPRHFSVVLDKVSLGIVSV